MNFTLITDDDLKTINRGGVPFNPRLEDDQIDVYLRFPVLRNQWLDVNKGVKLNLCCLMCDKQRLLNLGYRYGDLPRITSKL